MTRYKQITTRKEHQCFGCRSSIAKGSNVFRWTIFDEGVFSYLLCSRCHEYVITHLDSDDTFAEGELLEFVEADK